MAAAVVVKDKSDGKKKKKARRLRKVEINDKAGGWVKDYRHKNVRKNFQGLLIHQEHHRFVT